MPSAKQTSGTRDSSSRSDEQYELDRTYNSTEFIKTFEKLDAEVKALMKAICDTKERLVKCKHEEF